MLERRSMPSNNGMPFVYAMGPLAQQFSQLVAWVKQHEVMLWWIGAASATVTIGMLIAMPWVVSIIPDDYFAAKERPRLAGRSRHPVIRWLLRIGKNLLGLLLVLLGLVLSLPLVPGQGMVMAVAGLLLLDFPGKRRFEMWIIRRRGILRVINWFRAKKGRCPLVVWSPDELVTTHPEGTNSCERRKVTQSARED